MAEHTSNPLRTAMNTKGLSAPQLAEQLGVSPQSVWRWLDDVVPRRQLRQRIALILDVPSSDLWPDAGDEHEQSTIGEWPSAPAVPDAVWLDLIRSSEVDITIAAGSSAWLADRLTGFLDVFAAKKSMGQQPRVRLLFDDPNGASLQTRDRIEAGGDTDLAEGDLVNISRIALRNWVRLCEHLPGAEIRLFDSDQMWLRTVMRFDDRLLEWQMIGGRRGFLGPVQMHELVEPHGRFESLMAHVDWCWEQATPLPPQ